MFSPSKKHALVMMMDTIEGLLTQNVIVTFVMVMDSILFVQEDILICSVVVMVLDIGMDEIHDNDERISFVLTHHPF
jgi:hypothetical protein